MEKQKPQLTDKQIDKLKEFKKNLSDIPGLEDDDYYLTKWLKARCFDVKKAEEMYRASMAFRETWDVNNIDKFQAPTVIQKYLAGGTCGFDKEGSPLRFELFGHLDLYGLLYSCKKSDLVRTKVQQCEHFVKMIEQKSKQLNTSVDGIVVIFDMEGVTTKLLWPPGLKMYLYLVKILEDNYPEMVKKMFVINAPSYFQLFWTVCKPLVSEDMRKKIHICGKDYQSTLLSQIDEAELPSFLGGCKVGINGDRRCSEQICQGGEVPHEYYLWENQNAETMKTVDVGPGQQHCVDCTIGCPDSVIRWEFRTQSHDLGFGVTFRSGQECKKEEEIIPKERIKCNIVTEDGYLKCTAPGVYSLIFDNRYSWVTAKTVHYKVQVENRQEIES